MKQARSNLPKYFYQGDHRGSVLVEFALVLPVLMLLLFGAIEFGFAFREYQVLQNAAREGAHYSALPYYYWKSGRIRTLVNDYCIAENINPNPTPADGGVTVTVNQNYTIPIPSAPPSQVNAVRASQVLVVHTHKLIFGGAFLPGGGTITLQASAVFRNFY
jgi:Flp pilus assembly protein TadG